MKIVIKNMRLDNHLIPVPPGLSELLDRAGAWSSDEIPPPRGYRREVKCVNGQLVTELIYVASENSQKEKIAG